VISPLQAFLTIILYPYLILTHESYIDLFHTVINRGLKGCLRNLLHVLLVAFETNRP
jgi:hypothetical protein